MSDRQSPLPPPQSIGEPEPMRVVIDLADDPPEDARKIWRCAVCGHVGEWSDGWRWFGSFRQLEETGSPEFVVCSTECRNSDTAHRLATRRRVDLSKDLDDEGMPK